jgi:hypothetical protein
VHGYVEEILKIWKGLLRHLSGTARKPIEIEEKNGKVHKKGNATAMTDDEFETYLDSIDTYAQKEAQVREVLYDMLTKIVTLQIKGQLTAAHVWKKLMSIFERRHDHNRYTCQTRIYPLR